MVRPRELQMRVGLPLTGGALPAAARQRGYPVLFSANAFARTFPGSHERAGEFQRFRVPRPGQLDGLDAALDSAGFVAAARYGDYCCEPEIAADRPLRLLRIAATAVMLMRCNAEASRRGLPGPMPVLQGWTPAEYALCAEWLPLARWPGLVGLGSVCRRPVHGPAGILAILEAVDALLPPHVRLHLFGVKSEALAALAKHPRVASADSAAWDMQARAERRTGRDMAFRVAHMDAWLQRQHAAIDDLQACAALPRSLFDPAAFGGAISGTEELVLEALALQYADLLMEGQIEYRDAVWQAAQDGVWAVAKLRLRGMSDALLAEYDEDLAGFGERVGELMRRD